MIEDFQHWRGGKRQYVSHCKSTLQRSLNGFTVEPSRRKYHRHRNRSKLGRSLWHQEQHGWSRPTDARHHFYKLTQHFIAPSHVKMSNNFVLVTKQRAIEIARALLAAEEIDVVADSFEARYREKNLGLGEQDRGWVVFAKFDLAIMIDPDAVMILISDPDEKTLLPPII